MTLKEKRETDRCFPPRWQRRRSAQRRDVPYCGTARPAPAPALLQLLLVPGANSALSLHGGMQAKEFRILFSGRVGAPDGGSLGRVVHQAGHKTISTFQSLRPNSSSYTQISPQEASESEPGKPGRARVAPAARWRPLPPNPPCPPCPTPAPDQPQTLTLSPPSTSRVAA